MLKAHRVTTTLLTILTSLIAEAGFSHQLLAVPNSAANKQVCQMQTADGRTVNLDRLCGKSPEGANPAKPTTMNLEHDVNGDGIPDALVAEVKRIDLAKDKDAAIWEFISRLPYSAKTLALQQQAEPLHKQLSQAKDEAEAQAIVAQLRTLEKGMMADANYVRTMEGLQKMFAPKPVNFIPETDDQAQYNTAALVGTKAQLAKAPTALSDLDKIKTLLAFAGLTVNPISNVGLGVFSKPNVLPPAKKRIASANYKALRPGDIMLMRDPDGAINWAYAMWYNHAGTYAGNQQVYESNQMMGARFRPLSDWQKKGLYIGLGRNSKRSSNSVNNALQWAEEFYNWDGSTGYNYNYGDKVNDTDADGNKRVYCSQLIWKIHNHIGVDVDSNDPHYQAWVAARWGPTGHWAVENVVKPGIAPDEIDKSSNVTMYSRGSN